MGLKLAIALNILLSIAAIGFAILVQQMSGAMIRHSHFQFFQTVSDEDRRRIFTQAGAVVWIAIVPLLLSNIAWIVIGCIFIKRTTRVNPQPPTNP